MSVLLLTSSKCLKLSSFRNYHNLQVPGSCCMEITVTQQTHSSIITIHHTYTSHDITASLLSDGMNHRLCHSLQSRDRQIAQIPLTTLCH